MITQLRPFTNPTHPGGREDAPAKKAMPGPAAGRLAEPIRSVAQKRRKVGELIGLPIGTCPDYRYPVFQFNRTRHKIYDLVK